MTSKLANLITSLEQLVGRVVVNLDTKLGKTDIAVAANKLAVARSITLAGEVNGSLVFDGSADAAVSVSLRASGVTAGAYGSENAIPIATVNQKGIVTSITTVAPRRTVIPLSSVNDLPNTGELDVIYLVKNGVGTSIYRWNGVSYDNTTASTAVATSAEKLSTPRQFVFGGDIDGSAMFDGSANANFTMTLLNTGVNAGTYPKVTVDAKGRVTAGAPLSVSDVPTLNQDTTGNAATASKLSAIRTFALSGDVSGSADFDGSGNVNIVVTVEDSSHLHDMANINGLSTALSAKADLAGSTFSGINTAPTAAVGTNTLQLANCVYVRAEIGNLAPTKTGVGASGTWGISVTGSAATAAKLSTARSISFNGDATATALFDGSADVAVSVTLANTGVVAGNYGNDNSVATLTVDAKGRITAAGTTAIRAASISQSGLVQLNNTTTSTSTTQAATANSVKLAYDAAAAAIPLSQKGVANGVATLGADGFIPANQLPSYVDDVLEVSTYALLPVTGESGKIYTAIDTGKIYRWSGSSYIEISASAGNSDTATKLATARSISLTGDSTGSVSFDGSADVSITVTLANSGVTAGTYPKVTVDAKGRVTAGAALVAADIPSLDAGKITTGVIGLTLLSGTYASASIGGNAATATKLATARTLSLTGDGTASMSFDGSGNASSALTLANSGVTAGTYPKVTVDAKGRVTAGAALLEADIPALSIGKVTSLQTSLDAKADITGNVATATKLATARAISVSGDATGTANFDGSAAAAIAVTLASTGVTAGSYAKVTVDAKGRVTAGAALAAADIPVLDASKITTGAIADARISGSYTGFVNATGSGKATFADFVAGGTDTVSTPSYSWSGDLTTGLYHIAAGQIGVAVAGVQVATFTAAGIGGVGTNLTALNASNLGSGTVPDARLTTSNIGGNAATATKLATARAIAVSGDATGTANFDGSAGVSIAVTLANSGVAAGTYPKVTVDVKGRVTAGGALLATDIPTLNQNTTGNAATATVLATSRNISVTGDATGSAAFNGGADAAIAVTLATVPVAKGGTGGTTQASARTGLGLGSMSTRNVTVSTAAPSGGVDGDIWLQYA